MTDITDRETGELTSMPSITAERDDRVERKSTAPSLRRVVDDVPGYPPKTQKSPWRMRTDIMIALLVFAFAVVISGIVYLHDQLQKTQQSLETAAARVDVLEARLASTDTTMTKSEVLLSAKIKSMDGLIDVNKTEVRKLWGSVEKITKAAQSQNSELQQQKLLLQSVTVQAKQTADQVAADSVLLKNVDSAVKEAVQRMEIAQESINELSGDAKSLKDKQTRFEADTAKRVTTLEDTAKSTDVFRRNTQDELRKLREELSRQQTPDAGVRPAL